MESVCCPQTVSSLCSRRARVSRLLSLALLLLSVPTVVRAQFSYTTNNETLTIVDYTGPGGDVIIPGTVDGLPVTDIGFGAFQSKTNLTSITIPNSVTNIGETAFLGCTNLTTFTVDVSNPDFSSLDGVLFDKNRTLLIQYPVGKVGNYEVPTGVTNLGKGAFNSAIHLTSVGLPPTLLNISDAALALCTSLTNVTIPNSVTNLGSFAFAGSSLNHITIPDSIVSIPDSCFRRCTNLTKVALPNGLISIGAIAFLQCYKLSSFTLPPSLTTIGEGAFATCIGLTNISIGSNVVALGQSAFDTCFNLVEITVDPLNPSYSSAEGVLFDVGQTVLLRCPGGKGGNYTIPDTVTNIHADAFIICTNLTRITIPNSVTSIGEDAFSFCFSLTGVYFAGNSPEIEGSYLFGGPRETTVYYLPQTFGWGSEFGGGPTAWWQPEITSTHSPSITPTNQFNFNISWASGQTVVVEACTNLTDNIWLPIQTNTLTSSTFSFSDPQSTNYPTRFYRLSSPLPNNDCGDCEE